MKDSINSKDISIIVQGAIDDEITSECLKSIRRNLPESVIILSTWKNSNVDSLDYDLLIQNEDPGAEIYDEILKTLNNVNRQVLSTKKGLEKVQTKYALKLRSDLILENTNFLNYFNKYRERNNECKILKSRVVINNLYCRKFEEIKLLFHPSDWVFFGLTEDLKNIWDIQLQNEPESSKYFKDKERPQVDIIQNWLFKYAPEQYIWTSFLKKNGVSFNFDYFTDITNENILLSELSIVNNLAVVDYEDFGIKFVKYDPYKWNSDYESNITHYDWLILYKKYCSTDFKIPFNHKLHNENLRLKRKSHKVSKMLKKRIKHWNKF